MRYNTQITAKLKDKGNIVNYVTSVNLNENITVSEFKNEIKNSFKFLDIFSIENEVVYLGSKELQDTDIIDNNKSGLKFLVNLTNK